MKLEPAEADRFILRNTAIATPPLVPEIRLHLATEITPIWQATEVVLAEIGVAPPFWAFAWAGGQALARHILDHPECVAGKSVLDFGAGSGLLSIAARLAGAATVCAADIDPLACAAIRLNALENRVDVATTMADVIGTAGTVDTVLVGDMCYERPLAERLTLWLRALAGEGIEVLLGDPGRTYKPTSGLVEIARYVVPTTLELEDREQRDGVVWRVLPKAD
ncbi:MAG TPA: methyltransferase [Stellaceae bacterium]|nr:methyltransferase [Stellaceae bacterium]